MGASISMGSSTARDPHLPTRTSAGPVHLHDAELLPCGNNEFEPDNACQPLLACIEREEAFEFELERTGDVQDIELSAADSRSRMYSFVSALGSTYGAGLAVATIVIVERFGLCSAEGPWLESTHPFDVVLGGGRRSANGLSGRSYR